MATPSRRATVSVVVAAALTAGVMAASAPARATAQYSWFDWDTFWDHGEKVAAAPYTCNRVGNPLPPPADPGLPGNADNPSEFTEGGGPVTRTYSFGGTVTNSANAADTIAAGATASVTIRLNGAGGTFTGFEINGSGVAAVSPALGAASGCWAGESAEIYSETLITVAQPSWLILTTTSEGTAASPTTTGYYSGGLRLNEAEFTIDTNQVFYNFLGDRFSTSTGTSNAQAEERTLLAPGLHLLSSFFGVGASTAYEQAPPSAATFSASASATGQVRFSGVLQAPGTKVGEAKSEAKGATMVQFLLRGCAASTIGAKLSKKKLKNASKVVFSVNGKKVKVVKPAKKFPKKGLVTLTGIDGASDATVRATIVMRQKGAARPTVEQGYLPCS